VISRLERPLLALVGRAAMVQALGPDMPGRLEASLIARRRAAVLVDAGLERLARGEAALVGRAAGVHAIAEDLASDVGAAIRAIRGVAAFVDAAPDGLGGSGPALVDINTRVQAFVHHPLAGLEASILAGRRTAVLGDAILGRFTRPRRALGNRPARFNAVPEDLMGDVQTPFAAGRGVAVFRNAALGDLSRHGAADVRFSAIVDTGREGLVTGDCASLFAGRSVVADRPTVAEAIVEQVTAVVAAELRGPPRIETSIDGMLGVDTASRDTDGRTIATLYAAFQNRAGLTAAFLWVSAGVDASLECVVRSVVACRSTGVSVVVAILEAAFEGVAGEILADVFFAAVGAAFSVDVSCVAPARGRATVSRVECTVTRAQGVRCAEVRRANIRFAGHRSDGAKRQHTHTDD